MLEWLENGTPKSAQFEDIYYDPTDGLEESRYVFLGFNRLKERLPLVEDRFTIGELGFGMGINFLATWCLWRSLRCRCSTPMSSSAKLIFRSCEKYPVSCADFLRAHSRWPELSGFSRSLVEALSSSGLDLPQRSGGTMRIDFPKDQIELVLFLGDASSWLQGPESYQVNAWYLDGFAPAKNPDLWTPALMRALGSHSLPGATLATFSAASSVRRALEDAGFQVEKQKGYGRKRESVMASWPGELRVQR